MKKIQFYHVNDNLKSAAEELTPNTLVFKHKKYADIYGGHSGLNIYKVTITIERAN
jgi:hypothetical protein